MFHAKYVRELLLVGIYVLGILGIVACGGGGGGGSNGDDTPVPIAPSGLKLSFDIKTFRFTWADESNETHYRLLENPDGLAGFGQVGSDIPQDTETYDHTVPLYKRTNASYILQKCDMAGCVDLHLLNVSGTLKDAIGYFKASTTDASDEFGGGISLSGDGSTLAVGAMFEDSNATGINGDQSDNSALDSGAVYIFSHNGMTWNQQAYIKPSNTMAGANFGRAVSLSDDGNTLAVPGYVFTRVGTSWSQQDTITGGTAVSLSSDGNTVATGTADTPGPGAVNVSTRSGANWNHQATISASNPDNGDSFGGAVSLSDDGNTLAVGAKREDSNATGVNGNQADNSEVSSGAAYVFTRSGVTWSQQAYIKASNTDGGIIGPPGDWFGSSVILSGDGNTLAVGAMYESGGATGINGNQASNSAPEAGAVYVFTRSGITWAQQAYVKASNTGSYDWFGGSVSLNDDGNTLVVGAMCEWSNATGINGNQLDNSEICPGAAYVLNRRGGIWTQQAYVKASNSNENDSFGGTNTGDVVFVSISGDGNTLAVGAGREDSNAAGIGGNQANNSTLDAGAVYLY